MVKSLTPIARYDSRIHVEDRPILLRKNIGSNLPAYRYSASVLLAKYTNTRVDMEQGTIDIYDDA